jgi:hypothetical protein
MNHAYPEDVARHREFWGLNDGCKAAMHKNLKEEGTMVYTVWRKLNSTTYKFYMAAEIASVALNSAPNGAIITKTSFSFSYNYIHIDDLNKYPKL